MTEPAKIAVPNPIPPSPSPVLGYAASSPLASLGDLFRDGPILVARDGITLPSLCILCGNPATSEKPLRLKFTWDSSFKVTQKSTLQMRAAATVNAALCQTHHRRWKTGRLLGLIGMTTTALLMLASIITAIISESSDIPRYAPHAIATLLAAFALFIAFLFLFTLKTRTLKCIRIEAGYLFLENAHENFLKHLPNLSAESRSTSTT